MDHETRRRIEETVLDVLNNTSLEEMTEYKVRLEAGARLGIDLSSDMQCKMLVRNVVGRFLVSVMEREDKGKETEPGPSVRYENKAMEQGIVPKKEVSDDGDRLICQVKALPFLILEKRCCEFGRGKIGVLRASGELSESDFSAMELVALHDS